MTETTPIPPIVLKGMRAYIDWCNENKVTIDVAEQRISNILRENVTKRRSTDT